MSALDARQVMTVKPTRVGRTRRHGVLEDLLILIMNSTFHV